MDKSTRIRRQLIRDDPVEFTRAVLKPAFPKFIHRKQEQYLLNQAQFKTALWGRRAGKTTTDAIDLLHWAIRYPGCIQWNLSFTHDQALIAFGIVEKILRDTQMMELLAKKPVHTPFGEMHFINGSEIHARSLQHRGKYVRGYGGHRVKVDEAGIVPDSTILDVVMMMLADHDGQLCKSGTPWGDNHLRQSYDDGRQTELRGPLPGNFSLHCASWENPFISARYIETMRSKLPEIQFRTEVGAEFMDGIGKVFPWPIIQAAYNIVTPILAVPNPDHTYVAGWDFAKHLDWTVGIVLDITDEANLQVVYGERFQKESYEHVAHRVIQVSNTWNCCTVFADATGVGEPVIDRIGGAVANLEAVVFSSADRKVSLINNLKLLMEQGRLKFEWNDRTSDWAEELVSELGFYGYQLSPRSGHVLMGTQKEHDDTVTALALAAWAFSNNSVESAVGFVGTSA